MTAINDAPVNTVPGPQATTTHTGLAIAGLAISDVDAAAGSLTVTLAVNNGTLALSGSNVTGSGTAQVTVTGTVSQINTTLATNPVYTSGAGFTGNATLTLTTLDNGNTGNGGAQMDSDTVNISVNAPLVVNTAPMGTSTTLTFDEDTPRTLLAADFGFSDADTPANTLAAVRISTLPLLGTLAYDGTAITTTQVSNGFEVSAADLAANKLVYTPAADANGMGYASFNFQVRDNGGTANSGIDLDASPNTLSFNVSPVNDAPTLNGVPVAPQAVTAGVAAPLADFTVADIDSPNLTVTLTPTNGTLNGLTDADADTAGYPDHGHCSRHQFRHCGSHFHRHSRRRGIHWHQRRRRPSVCSHRHLQPRCHRGSTGRALRRQHRLCRVQRRWQ